MSKVSFEEIGSLMVTFYAQEGVQAGQVVRMAGNSTVGPCQDADTFCGVAISCKGGLACVQVDGFVTVAASGLSVGPVKLVADGKGGVKTGDDGVSALVVDVDNVAGTAVIGL